MALKFINKDHRDFYFMQIAKTHSSNDPFRKALFYALGLTEESRKHINSLYDYEEGCISLEGLRQPWQTGTSMKVTRLAFNLYNGFNGDEEGGDDPARYYTPYSLFDSGLMPFMFEAVKLLYQCYTEEVKQCTNVTYAELT